MFFFFGDSTLGGRCIYYLDRFWFDTLAIHSSLRVINWSQL